jgi:hypothetical protein
MHGRGKRGIVVGTGDRYSPTAGERGGEIILGGSMLEDGDGGGDKDKDDAEDYILDKAALGTGNSGRVHRANTHKYASGFF